MTLGQREEALGRAWHLPSPETVTTREFLELVFAFAGHPPRIRRLPRIAVAAIGLVNPRLRGASEIVYQYDDPFVVDHARFQRVLGGEPTPLRDAIATTVEWFRAHPVRRGPSA